MQLLIALTAAVAVFLILLPDNDPRRRWACIIGLIGQPGWLANAWALDTWGALVGALAFTVAYLADFRRQWWPGIEAAWQAHVAKLRAEAQASLCYGSANRRHNWHHSKNWHSGYYADPRKVDSSGNRIVSNILSTLVRSGMRCSECGERRWDQTDEAWLQSHGEALLLPKGARYNFDRDSVDLPPGATSLEQQLSEHLWDPDASTRLRAVGGQP